MYNVETIRETMKEVYHYPVMHRELIDLLDIRNKKVIVDCTIGVGSHALNFFEAAGKDSYLIGIDKDEDSLNVASQRLRGFEGRFTLVRGDFSNIDNILGKLGIKEADIFLFDLGISTYQLSSPERGFSFLKEGPLDMRMDRNSFLSASDLVNNLSEIELINIFRKFGEEHYAKRFAQHIVQERRTEPIISTAQLSRIILEVCPSRALRYRVHPATRVFQALRIAVNRELESLPLGIKKAISFLSKKGRIAVISFHSLEDRIAKHTFKDYSLHGILKVITKKPLLPSAAELEENNASRSAKLRVAEKV
ncbi:MAG: 16S rRNA (cytosine(1402)-N(4))-methyltransferase RsmH [Candidatus Omnitrophota bacterium]|nr:16S rRNA (cytosine(1402)-N(4))-methyltransferase RsmH [Candidatus Omnitrophota bacterium]